MNVLLVGGQLVLEGLVALGTFLVHLGEAVWDWGMAVAGAVGEAANEAIQKAGEVATALIDWAWDFIIAALDAAFGPLVTAILNLLESWALDVLASVTALFALSTDGTAGAPPPDSSAAAASLFGTLSQPALAFIGLFTTLRVVEAVIGIATGSIIGLQVAKEAASQFLQEYVIYLIFQAFLWGTVATLANTAVGDVDNIVVDAFTEVGFFFGMLGAAIEVAKKVAEFKAKGGEPSPVRRGWAAGLAFTGLLLMLITDILGWGTGGLPLFLADALGYFLVVYNAIEYRERSKDFENQTLDVPSPISSKLEAITTYGTVVVGAGTIVAHAAEERYW